MNIIEKLGITPGPWISLEDELDGGYYIESSDSGACLALVDYNNISGSQNNHIDKANSDVMAAAPEMLEALIDVGIDYQAKTVVTRNFPLTHKKQVYGYKLKKITDVLEKATGKTWDEIKELKH